MFRDGVQHLGLYSHLAQPGCGTDELFHFAHLIDSDRAITTCAASEIVLFTPPPIRLITSANVTQEEIWPTGVF